MLGAGSYLPQYPSCSFEIVSVGCVPLIQTVSGRILCRSIAPPPMTITISLLVVSDWNLATCEFGMSG